MIEKRLETNTFFHEEAHIYFKNEDDFKKFSESYSKNPDWALKNKSKWNPVMSITQILSDFYPFTGGDLKITKAWFEKEALYKKADQKWITDNLETLKMVEEYLSESVGRSQEEGTEGHENIQDFIEFYIKEKVTDKVKSNNIYWKAFIKELLNKENNLGAYVKDIKTILPSEIPIVGEVENASYAGKWDLLVELSDGTTALIDIKTGSPLEGEKKEKVFLQLNGYAELIKQSIGIEVDKMYCWEVSYVIPYKELKKQLSSLKSRLKKSKKQETIEKLIDEMASVEYKMEVIEEDNKMGEREYYFKWHEFNKTDLFKEIVKSVFNKREIKRRIKEESK